MKTLTLLASALILISHAPAARADHTKPLHLTPTDAVRRALRKNLGHQHERLAPELSGAHERKARAFTDPVIFGELGANGTADRLADPKLRIPTLLDVSGSGAVGVKKTFMSGTALEARLSGTVTWDTEGSGADTTLGGAATLSVRHPLLRGGNPAVNSAEITTARLSRQAAELRLRRKAEVLAADTLKAYWDLHAAESNLRVQRVALAQADKTLAETKQLVAAGKLAASEELMARHQVQTQRRAVLLAAQSLQNGRDLLARKIGLVGPRSLATPAITTGPTPTLPAPPRSLGKLQRLALERRGDYQALEVERRTRGVVERVARHKLLPKLDLVGTASVNGRRGRLSGPDLAAELDPTTTGRVTWAVGVVFEIPLGNREAKASIDLAALGARRAEVALHGKQQDISLELKQAWRALHAARALVRLSDEAVRVASVKHTNEKERYASGRTTAQLLVLVQSELVRERLAQQQARSSLHKARVDLWSAAGSLLQQLGTRPR